MIAEIVGALSSVGFGSIIGAIGGYLSKVEERKMQSENNAFKLKLMDLQIKEALQEKEHELAMVGKQIERTEMEGAVVIGTVEAEAFKKSIEAQQIKSGVRWVDALRSLMRPLITLFLLGVSTYLAIQISLLLGGLKEIDKDELMLIFKNIINQVLFLAATATLWWFASRHPQMSKVKK
jgi:uncharacterized membrane protein (Fun14 family)